MTDVSDDLALALRLARQAEEISLAHFGRTTTSRKPDGSEVTEADRAAEAELRATLAAERPDDAILGEEMGGNLEDRPTWILDPIDGTFPYSLGLPTFGNLVALARERRVVVGVIALPAMGRRVYAARGEGCWLQHGDAPPLRLRTRAVDALDEVLVSAASLHRAAELVGESEALWRVRPLTGAVRRVRFLGDCTQHALVCEGRIQMAIDPKMSTWDYAALVPCVEEAGGRITEIDGSPLRLGESRTTVSTCGGALHDELLQLLQV